MSNLSANLDLLKNHLAKIPKTGLPNHIGGIDQSAISGETLEIYSPVDNSFICTVAKSNAQDIDNAAKSAKSAFPIWRDLDPTKRKTILHKIADGICARSEEIALCESWDTGQPIRYMAKAALRGAENFRFFADRAVGARDGLHLPSGTLMNITTRVPIGPVGVITPWNTPFMLSTWKIAPALAAGCTVVHKPAEFSPLTARILMDVAHAAGLPDGVLNLVNGNGEEAGRALTEHKDIKAIAFVGESKTGSMIMQQGAATLKRVHFELGGKNPVVVFEDADLERALDAVVFMIYSLNGERCTSSSRLLIQKSIADKFIKKLINRVNAIRVGHPLDPEIEMGPLIHQSHFDKVMSYFQIARDEGADILAGGARLQAAELQKGWYVMPTLFGKVNNSMRVAQEEIFGPVLSVIEFSSEEEALQIANDIEYGLTAYLWTKDITRATRFTHQLEAGMIWVNSENVRHLPTPFGGVKASGIGRDGGDWSFEFYMEQKHIGFALGQHPIPKLGEKAER